MNKIKKLEKLIYNNIKKDYFGSKSDYRKNNPKSNPLFNSYILTKDDYGILQKTNKNIDIELTDQDTINLLKDICKELKQDIFFYRESTVHNNTFTGKIFRYNDRSLHIEYFHNKINVKIRN